MLIAQVTDTHLLDPARGTGPYVDHAARLREAFERVDAEDPPVDLVVLTGDLVDTGSGPENELLSDVLDGLTRPVVGVPGNHDHRETFPERLLPNGRPQHEHLSWAIDDHEVRIVGLDTTIPGRHGGTLDAERAAWLDQTLAAEPHRPTLLAMHHPPFLSGIEWMDREGLPVPEVRSIVARHPQVQRIIAGHLHRPIQSGFDHAAVSVGLATVHHVECDLRPGSRPRLIVDPAGYQLHQWSQGSWVTHTRYIATGAEAFVPDWAS